MTYSAYGETSIGNRGQDKISTNNVFYYTSRELEPETGDYFYRARYYDPKVGRFLSEDPIHFAGGDYNLYRYVGSQPVVLRDPSGKAFFIPVLIGGIVYFILGDQLTGGDDYAPYKGPINSDPSLLDDWIYRYERERLLRELENEKNLPPNSCIDA